MAILVREPDEAVIPADGIIDIPHRVITKANVDEFHAELNKLLGK